MSCKVTVVSGLYRDRLRPNIIWNILRSYAELVIGWLLTKIKTFRVSFPPISMEYTLIKPSTHPDTSLCLYQNFPMYKVIYFLGIRFRGNVPTRDLPKHTFLHYFLPNRCQRNFQSRKKILNDFVKNIPKKFSSCFLRLGC